MRASYIIGLASYVPAEILTNRDLEQRVATCDEWIVARTGMRERRIAARDEHPSTMGVQAALGALSSAGADPDQIELVICATMTPDVLCPATANLIQSQLNCSKAGAFDLQAACSGFIYALACARAFVEAGIYDRILVVSSEKMSAIVDPTDRDTCVLFGDGAAACVVGAEPRGWKILQSQLGSDGREWAQLTVPAGGTRNPTALKTVENRQHFLKMNGKEVFKHAVRRMGQVSEECLTRCGLQSRDLSWLICHQANLRIIEAVGNRLEIPAHKFVTNIDRFGNTSAASIPLVLDDLQRDGRLLKGQLALLAAFGAGFNWGAVVLQRATGPARA